MIFETNNLVIIETFFGEIFRFNKDRMVRI